MFTIVVDPVGQGFVASLARPGGHVTGFSSYDPQVAGKWVEMLTQITPPVARMAVLFDPATAPYAGLMLREIDEAARKLAAATRPAPCHDAADIEAMVAQLAREEHSGLVVLPASSPIATGTRSSPLPPATACPRSIPRASSSPPAG